MPASPATDRIAELEARVAELERHRSPMRWHPQPRLLKRLALLALTVALIIPAGVLANHQFNDVPTSNQFHNAISAIADAGITTGCPQGTNNYCPNGLVTRGQMAAFLSRLGALQPGSDPKVNADKVDGRHANQLLRVAEMEEQGFEEVLGPLIQYGDDLVINAPTTGYLLVSASVRFSGSGCFDGACVVETWINHIGTGNTSMRSVAVVPAEVGINTVPVQAVFTAAAGENRFELYAGPGLNDDPVYITWANMTATFIPFGPTGGQP